MALHLKIWEIFLDWKKNEAINRITRDITIIFDREEVDYYIPVRVGIFYNDNYIRYENHGDKNITP